MLCCWFCRSVKVQAKHSKRITCGAWSKQKLLALGGEDHSVTVSNADGDTIHHLMDNGDLCDIQFSEVKLDEPCIAAENTVSSSSLVVLQVLLAPILRALLD